MTLELIGVALVVVAIFYSMYKKNTTTALSLFIALLFLLYILGYLPVPIS